MPVSQPLGRLPPEYGHRVQRKFPAWTERSEQIMERLAAEMFHYENGNVRRVDRCIPRLPLPTAL